MKPNACSKDSYPTARKRRQIGIFYWPTCPKVRFLTLRLICSLFVSMNFCFRWIVITKTCLCNFDPLKPHFYIVKLVFTGVCIIFSYFIKNIDCGYSLEPPHRGGSYEYPQSIFREEIWKISDFFLSENFPFLVVKFSIYLNMRVFVMDILSKYSALIRYLRSDYLSW